MHSVDVDAAAGLAMAIHMGIPIFMDGEFSPAEPGGAERTSMILREHEGRAQYRSGGTADENATEIEPGIKTPIPRVFQDLIDGLGMPDEAATAP